MNIANYNYNKITQDLPIEFLWFSYIYLQCAGHTNKKFQFFKGSAIYETRLWSSLRLKVLFVAPYQWAEPSFLLWQKIILSEMAIFQMVMMAMAYMKRLWEKNFSQRRWWFQDFWFLQIAKTVIVSNMKKKMPLQIFFFQ